MAENFRTPREPCSEERPVCRIARGLSGPRAVAVSHQPLPRQHPLDDIRMRTRLCGRILQNACHQGHLRWRRNRHDQHSDQRKPGGNPAYHWQTVAHCPSLRIAQQRPLPMLRQRPWLPEPCSPSLPSGHDALLSICRCVFTAHAAAPCGTPPIAIHPSASSAASGSGK